MGTKLQFPVDLLTFTKEIINGKPHFLCKELMFSDFYFDLLKNL